MLHTKIRGSTLYLQGESDHGPVRNRAYDYAQEVYTKSYNPCLFGKLPKKALLPCGLVLPLP